jgi:hypothetical protein
MHHTKSFLPRTYGLSWDAKSFSLLFRIEKRMIPLIKKFLNMETPLIAELCKDYPVVPNFDSFAHAHQAFGFDNTFVYEREDEHELVYRFALKPVMYQSDETCTECDGTKISIFSNLPCRACRQTGKEYRPVENTYFTSGIGTARQRTGRSGPYSRTRPPPKCSGWPLILIVCAWQHGP